MKRVKYREVRECDEYSCSIPYTAYFGASSNGR